MAFRAFLHRLVRPGLYLVLLGGLIFGGVQLRRWTWEETTHLRFQHDIVNGFYWGSQTVKNGQQLAENPGESESWTNFFRGYLGLYDRVRREAYDHQYNLDYPPLRLLVMSIWARQVRKEFPGVEDGTPDYVEPLLRINVLCELLTAVGIFLLVRRWMDRASPRTQSNVLLRVSNSRRGWMCAFAAACIAWFEPSMVLDAHGWPQWDVWIVPFYLFAVLAALTNRWMWCGVLLAAGAMLKGQLLFVVPFFVFWPLWQRRWSRAFRVLNGFFLTVSLIASPWLFRSPAAWLGVVAFGCASWLLFVRWSPRNGSAWAAVLTAVTAFGIGTFGGGSFAWLQIGFLYGAEHYPYLFISSCYNLPSLLSDLGFGLKDALASFNLGPVHVSITPQWTLRFTYLGAIALCSLGAARHWRARDPRLLIAIAAPWLLMFVLLGQMHERYLMWGAVLSAVAVAVSVRLTLLHFILSIASTAMIGHVMLIDKKLDPTLRAIDLLHGVRPYASSVVLVCVAVFFWQAFRSRINPVPRWRVRDEEKVALALAPAGKEA